jgi:hypothetical protein
VVDPAFYLQQLYPFQDEVLQVINAVETDFYLTGGTAASRGYLQHRFSDDLDLFVNDDPRFQLWSQRLIQALITVQQWQAQINLRDERFVRLTIYQQQLSLKIELINDVPAHIGMITEHPTLGRLDSAENILANKVTATVSREEPKDLSDIWGFCYLMGLSLDKALSNAHSKAAGIFPADLARILCSVTQSDWELIRWHTVPDSKQFISDLCKLGEVLVLI